MTLNSILFPLAGGALIGLAASLMLLFNGRIAGISGITCGAIQPKKNDWSWRVLFLAGLLSGGLLLRFFFPQSLPSALNASTALVVAAGLLVGFGSVMANGCTSGHGVCGITRGSPRSLAATATFMLTGALTVFVIRHLLGGH